MRGGEQLVLCQTRHISVLLVIVALSALLMVAMFKLGAKGFVLRTPLKQDVRRNGWRDAVNKISLSRFNY